MFENPDRDDEPRGLKLVDVEQEPADEDVAGALRRRLLAVVG